LVNDQGTILVTGGAGYIGSHAIWALHDAGRSVVVIDDLSTGNRDLLPGDVTLIVGDAGDRGRVEALIGDYGCTAVMHFAGSIVVGESVDKPLAYYANNAGVTLNLIRACLAGGIKRFVYSSTAAVYGQPIRLPVGEDAPTQPLNPYGHSKLMAEQMLCDAARAHGLQFAILRYFNVAGADPEGRTGQSSIQPTHLIKRACQAALGLGDGIEIFGTDYDTIDGTCVRDYLHVSDLAETHLAALSHLAGGGESLILNCGYGGGASVRQVLAAVEAEAGMKLNLRTAARRPGDAAELVADAKRIRAALGWQPRHDDLRFIVRTALAWERHLIARRNPAIAGP
jgi:UDP-glucose 4-epimerase